MTTQKLKIYTYLDRDLILITLVGVFNYTQISYFNKTIKNLLQGNHIISIYFNFKHLSNIDIGGLGQLLWLTKNVPNVYIYGVNDFIMEMFEVTGINKIYKVSAKRPKHLKLGSQRK